MKVIRHTQIIIIFLLSKSLYLTFNLKVRVYYHVSSKIKPYFFFIWPRNRMITYSFDYFPSNAQGHHPSLSRVDLFRLMPALLHTLLLVIYPYHEIPEALHNLIQIFLYSLIFRLSLSLPFFSLALKKQFINKYLIFFD